MKFHPENVHFTKNLPIYLRFVMNLNYHHDVTRSHCDLITGNIRHPYNINSGKNQNYNVISVVCTFGT